MARYKNIRRTASVRYAVKFWWNIVKNYDEVVYDQDFFDLIAYNLKRDEVAAIIRGNISEKELKPLVEAKEDTLELERDNVCFMLKRIWNEKPLRKGCRTVLFTSSGAVYGPGTAPVDETAPCRPATAYGKGKLAAERLLLESGLDVKIARCFAFTGPYLNKNIHYAIGNFMRDCLAGNDIVINGDGTPRRSYLYADDLVEWLFAILERGEAGRPYNVGSDAAVSILELAETVRRVLGAKNDIVVKGAPQGGPPSVYVPEIGRAREELGLDVRIGLEEAIRRSV